MSKFSAKLIKFNKDTYQVLLDLSFVDEDLVEYLEDLEESSESYIWTVEGVHPKRLEIHDGQRKRWFHMISKILKFFKIPLGAKAINSLSVDFKFHYLPVNYIKIGDRDIPEIPSLKRCANNPVSPEKMQEALDQILETYTAVGVKFDEA